jgi:hypothetical protein
MSRYLCDARLFDIGSYTDPDKTYRVAIPTDPAVEPTCTCPNFRFRGDGSCKHIMDIYDALADDAFPELLRGRPEEEPEPFCLVDLLAQTFAVGYQAGAKFGTKFGSNPPFVVG